MDVCRIFCCAVYDLWRQLVYNAWYATFFYDNGSDVTVLHRHHCHCTTMTSIVSAPPTCLRRPLSACLTFPCCNVWKHPSSRHRSVAADAPPPVAAVSAWSQSLSEESTPFRGSAPVGRAGRRPGRASQRRLRGCSAHRREGRADTCCRSGGRAGLERRFVKVRRCWVAPRMCLEVMRGREIV